MFYYYYYYYYYSYTVGCQLFGTQKCGYLCENRCILGQ